jgi:hypothetical protein
MAKVKLRANYRENGKKQYRENQVAIRQDNIHE